MIPTPVHGSISKEELYENLWMVDKPAYDACTVDTSKVGHKLLLRCSRPLQLQYLSIAFRRFSAEVNGLVFLPGKDYYFIATSTGRERSLDKTSGGRCLTHNMRIKIHVCNDANDPGCTTASVSTAQPTKTVTVCPTPTQAVHISSTAVTQQPYCSTANKHEMSELINNTRIIPEIFDHTSQLTNLWAHLKNMTEKLDAIQDKLENCTLRSVEANERVTEPIPTTPTPVYSDCKELCQAGFNVSGVYVIRPKGSNDSLPVYCDQITEEGGWIVIQKRFDGSVRFSDRKWIEYQNGFGNLAGEFWLGLDKIHLLTKTPVRIRFDLGAPDGAKRFAVYQGFTIAGADQKYKLTTGKYIDGDGGDSFTSENGKRFSTVDQDNDLVGHSCAQTYKSGWWHGRCHQGSLNGLYLNGSDTNPNHFASGITWYTWKGYKYFLTKSEMKIRLWP